MIRYITSVEPLYSHQKALIFKYFNEKIDNLLIQAAVDNGQNCHKAIQMIGLPALIIIIMNSVSGVCYCYSFRLAFRLHPLLRVYFYTTNNEI